MSQVMQNLGLTPIQEKAVTWNKGAVLVLAGPGAGKTRVLTARIARLLDESRNKNYRILALTFTTKAAKEMQDRIESLVPGLSERAFVSTFHAFCAQILRQHGSHIGIRPDFGIYDQDSDRESLLRDALADTARRGENISVENAKWLKTIDELKSQLILPEKVRERVSNQVDAVIIEKVYKIYEQALRAQNLTDFNGLILETCRLMRDFPAVAARLRRSYPYWLIDEFQDTTPAQSKLIRLMSGDDFKNIFVVADDDQIIYRWNGASYKQIELFRRNYQPEFIQLVENHRCPPEVVEAANNLVAYNTQRSTEKKPLIATRTNTSEPIAVKIHEDELEECESIASMISASGPSTWSKTVILGRTRALLAPFLDALNSRQVPAIIPQRRGRFVSPQFVWLHTCLDQSIRPTDKQIFTLMVDAANRVSELQLNAPIIMAEAEASGRSYFEQWSNTILEQDSLIGKRLGSAAKALAQSRSSWKKIVRDIIPILLNPTEHDNEAMNDILEDKGGWDACLKEIRTEKGGDPDLAELVQGLALRSKEPPYDPNSVTILTVHAAKGLEFDHVYLVGLAESILPSWQSIRQGVASPEMEEERRNCFVAITRTREKIVLSSAKKYNGRDREVSRFLKEMGFVGTAAEIVEELLPASI